MREKSGSLLLITRKDKASAFQDRGRVGCYCMEYLFLLPVASSVLLKVDVDNHTTPSGNGKIDSDYNIRHLQATARLIDSQKRLIYVRLHIYLWRNLNCSRGLVIIHITTNAYQ
jgi:hypothetical protein